MRRVSDVFLMMLETENYCREHQGRKMAQDKPLKIKYKKKMQRDENNEFASKHPGAGPMKHKNERRQKRHPSTRDLINSEDE